MHPVLKIWNEAKGYVKIELPCKKTIVLQSALKITQDKAHTKSKKSSLTTFLLRADMASQESTMKDVKIVQTFLLLHIINQHSKPRYDILFNSYHY